MYLVMHLKIEVVWLEAKVYLPKRILRASMAESMLAVKTFSGKVLSSMEALLT